jgi:hypothetical protein
MNPKDKNQPLWDAFTQAINWNALFYIVYKVLFTTLSLLLYKNLTATDFTFWANLNSSIFLILLWTDFGFRKSIPRYCPEFSHDKSAEKTFLIRTLLFKILILCASTPLFIYAIKNLAHLINPTHYLCLLSIASTLFIVEGIIAIQQLIFHSYFWNKQFNLLSTIVMTIEMLVSITLLYSHEQPLRAILTTKIIGGIIIILTSMILLLKLYKIKKPLINRKQKNNTEQGKTTQQLYKEFATHSLIMGVNNNLKSLSERNFIIILLTHTVGHIPANIFKVANDGALLFYRIVIKVIGTADTSLLSYIEVSKQKKELMNVAFKKITTKVAGLCFPLFGLVFISLFLDYDFFNDTYVFQLFAVMACGYLSETMLLPFERVLEVKRQYKSLLIAYVPYTIMIIFLLNGSIITSFGLLWSITLIHSVRLVSITIMYLIVYTRYNLSLPITYITRLAIWSTVITGILIYILSFLSKSIQSLIYLIPFFHS